MDNISNSNQESAEALRNHSSSGAIAITNDNNFASTTARDTYFTANPTKLVANMYIQVGTGFQRRDGTLWVAVTAITKGEKGDKGDPGANGAQGAQGIQGIQGIQGATGATGASGIIWKGQYAAGTAYIANDAVGYSGSTYYCILATTGNLPTNTTYWQPLALQGATGPQGAQGIQGLQGAAGGDIGDIKMTALGSPTTGWLLCDGLAVSRTTYAGLFTAIGTTYGAGDGSTTFNLPNIKGRVPVGLDVSQTEFSTLGKTGGAKTHKLTIAEMPAHKHTINDNYGTQDLEATWNNGNACDEITRTEDTSTVGGDGYHNNLQPYIVFNYVIKY